MTKDVLRCMCEREYVVHLIFFCFFLWRDIEFVFCGNKDLLEKKFP